MNTRHLMAALGYGGLLPFYASALWAALALPGADWAVRAFVVYATVILAFLGGTLWGYAVTVAPPAKYTRLVLSNLVALFAAVAALAGSSLISVLMLGVGQVALLSWERAQGDSGGWYLRLRTRLTLGVLPAHLLMAFALVP